MGGRDHGAPGCCARPALGLSRTARRPGFAVGPKGHPIIGMGAGSVAIRAWARSRGTSKRESGTRSRRADPATSSGLLLAIVNARGQVDAGHIEPFAAELERGLEAGATQLLVDLSD